MTTVATRPDPGAFIECFDRRRTRRVAFEGTVQWCTRHGMGTGAMLDISPTGAGFRIPQSQAVCLAGPVELAMQLAPELTWQVTDAGRIVQIVPHDEETCRVCVAFPRDC
jgi:hypothetical protein